MKPPREDQRLNSFGRTDRPGPQARVAIAGDSHGHGLRHGLARGVSGVMSSRPFKFRIGYFSVRPEEAIGH